MPGGVAGDVERLENGHTAGDEGAEGAGESRDGALALHVAEERQLQLHGVDPASPALGGLDELPEHDQAGGELTRMMRMLALHPAAEADDRLGELGQLVARTEHVLEDLLELGHDDRHQEDHDAHGDDHDDDGIDHRGHDLVLELLGLFLVFGEPVEHEFEHAAQFAGLDHVDVKLVENLRECWRLSENVLPVCTESARVLMVRLHHRIRLLPAQHGETAQQRQAGIDQRRELARENHERSCP